MGYSERYEAALILAAREHRAQNRKGTDIPYITHLVHVSLILARYGFSEPVVIAGLLHDVVEDQGYPLALVEAEFGAEVAEMVAALSEQKRDDAGQRRPWLERKVEGLEKLRRASAGAVAVKAADTLHNARSLVADLRSEGAGVWERFNAGPSSSLWYYQSVARIVRERLGDHPLAIELEEAVAALACLMES
ncbi:MAG: HD domain-containing protein [Anaerolineae bacterium]|nr:HD domain-containing protein [Anaerolineae bacterium]